MLPVRTIFDVSRDLGAVRRYFTHPKESQNLRDLSKYSDWWKLPSDRLDKLVREYWQANLLPREVHLSEESNRSFLTIERELEEPLITSKRKRVLVSISAARQEPSGWHFRIPLRTYEIWALLCWDGAYQLKDFIVPQKFYAQPFSQAKKASKEDSIHVRVWQLGDRWKLSFLPRREEPTRVEADDPIDITDLFGQYSPLL